jgi:hypothetical protein
LKHLDQARRRHEQDLKNGLGRVALPNALERKYPHAGKDWAWQWVFAAPQHYTDKLLARDEGTIFTNLFYKGQYVTRW